MWFLIAFILGAGLLGLAIWLHNKRISLTWYEWLIGLVGIVLLLFTIQNFTASFAEYNPKAAWLILGFIGLPALILLAVTWQLVRRHKKMA